MSATIGPAVKKRPLAVQATPRLCRVQARVLFWATWVAMTPSLFVGDGWAASPVQDGKKSQAIPNVATQELDRKQRILHGFISDTHRQLQRQVQLLYILSERRKRLWLGRPNQREQVARATGATVHVVRRTLQERNALKNVIAQVGHVQARLQSKIDESAAGVQPVDTSEERPAPPGTGPRSFAFHVPLEGAKVVQRPGVSPDRRTRINFNNTGVTFVPHQQKWVRAPALGAVTRTASTYDGRHAIQITHPEGWSSILWGLSTLEIRTGDELGPDTILGTVAMNGSFGRSLNTSKVPLALRWDLWQGRTAANPTEILKAQKDSLEDSDSDTE